MSDQMPLGEILGSIHHTKVDVFLDIPEGEMNKAYVPYVINTGLSYFPDTILHANYLNGVPFIPKRIHYLYCLHAIRRKRRYAQWNKKPSIQKDHSDLIECIKRVFKYSQVKAEIAAKLLSKEQKDRLLLSYKNPK